MDTSKDVRWRQRFENFEKSFRTLERYTGQNLYTELERAGLIQLFEVTFELAWKVMKDYLEAEGFSVKSPRDTIKTAFQTGLIEHGHVWMDALSNRNLAAHTYDPEISERLVKDIVDTYFSELKEICEKLRSER